MRSAPDGVGTADGSCPTEECGDSHIPNMVLIDDDGMDTGEKPAQPDLNRPFDIFAEIVRSKYSNPKVGMEIETLAYPRCAHAMQVFGSNLSDCTDLLRKVRTIKTPWEIEILRRAAKSAERAMFETAGYISTGWTQAEVLYGLPRGMFQGRTLKSTEPL